MEENNLSAYRPRQKVVLEGALVELVHNEYDKYLSIDDLMVQVDAQVALGSITKEEGEQVANMLGRVKELKNNEIVLLQTLNRIIFNMIRPKPEETADTSEIDGQISISDLDKEKAVKGVNIDNKEG